jgi:hypothetical protein
MQANTATDFQAISPIRFQLILSFRKLAPTDGHIVAAILRSVRNLFVLAERAGEFGTEGTRPEVQGL